MENKWKEIIGQIPVPDSLEPKQMERRLQQEKRPVRRSGRWSYRIAATAASLLFVLAVANAIYSSHRPPETVVDMVATDDSALTDASSDAKSSGAMAHTSYEKLRETISDYFHERTFIEKEGGDILYGEAAPGVDSNMDAESENIAREEVSKSSGAADTASDTSYTKTDLQVQGVDEGDIIKTDGTYIYSCVDSAYGSIIRIYHANGKDTEKISQIQVDEMHVSELYLQSDRLIAVGTGWSSAASRSDPTLSITSSDTCIAIYDISDAKNPVLCAERSQSGEYYTSRKNGNYLYTLSTMWVSTASEKDNMKNYIPLTDGELFPEDRLYLPESTSSNSYLVLTALDVSDGDTFSDRLSILGAGGVCYVSENHIFVAANVISDYNKMTISKYKYENGTLTAVAERMINGVLHDQFSMDEYNGYLRFVATTYHQNGSTSNGLYILDQDLKPVGSVEKLAKNERIYSARFLGDRAYFVTYRETDPVFLVDLSDPKDPVVKDKLKLPGFSDYLHTFGDDLLLGIGSNVKKDGTAQVKLSMFDISSKTSVKELHTRLLEDDTKSLAGENHKAVLVDTERTLIGLCIYTFPDYIDDETYSYRIYSYDADGFHKVASLHPKDLYETARGLFIGSYFYLVDENADGIYVYDAQTWKRVK